MPDRKQVMIEFKKFIWLCPFCAQEDIEDAHVDGGNTYEHNCSKCGEKFNQSGPNLKEYNGVLTYPFDKFETVKDEDVAAEKVAKCENWLYEYKNPVPYDGPTKEVLEKQLAEKQMEIAVLQAQISEKG